MPSLAFNQELAIALYESAENFPIDLDDAWQWLGYAKKQNAKDKLIRNFEDNLDFRITQMRETEQDGSFSHCYERIELTIDCFKSLGMMAGTEQGKAIISKSWNFHQGDNLYDYSIVHTGSRVKSTISGMVGVVTKKEVVDVSGIPSTTFITVEWSNGDISHPYPHQIAVELIPNKQV